MAACPKCGIVNEDDAKNCRECRINLYWAFQHYEELTAIRQANQLPSHQDTPSFLMDTSKRIDTGLHAGWLHGTIKKFGFKEAGKKVSTITE
ncbi:MAG TPA: hypothetical protein VFV38_13195 [Ktedonobacteraceae bacterium]|nr:hypothetical protein [Ktedonobacteraceae bacterium]